MRIKIKVFSKLEKYEVGRRIITEQRYRVILFATVSFSLNLLYAFYHGILGVVNCSLWFITMCAYYIILGTMRFSAVLCSRKSAPAYSIDTEYFVMRLSGILLIVLCFVLTGVIYISLSQNIATKHDTVTMIAIATYTFGKITMAIIKAVKQHNDPSPVLAVIRTIGYAEVAASVLTLQCSMLASFGAMHTMEILRMNACTGAAVCLFVLILGIVMIVKGKERIEQEWQSRNS